MTQIYLLLDLASPVFVSHSVPLHLRNQEHLRIIIVLSTLKLAEHKTLSWRKVLSVHALLAAQCGSCAEGLRHF